MSDEKKQPKLVTRKGQSKEYNPYTPDMKDCPHCEWSKEDFCNWYQTAYTATTTSASCAWPWHIKLCGLEDDTGNAANPTEEEKIRLPKVAMELKKKAGWKTKPAHAHSPKDKKRKLRLPFKMQIDTDSEMADATDEEYTPPRHSVKRPRKEPPKTQPKQPEQPPPKPLEPLESLKRSAQLALEKAQQDKKKLGDRAQELVEEIDEVKRMFTAKEEEIGKIEKMMKAS